jgi:CYTH domain-containing protein
MGIEIERKFLVKSDGWRAAAESGIDYRQGYLSHESGRTVRVRIAERKAYLTVKGAASGNRRAEYEYEIPVEDAEEMLAMCAGMVIEKTRFRVPHAGLVWEVDVFAGENAGLIVAEVELESEDQVVPLPEWVGQEVSEEKRYSNSKLSMHPFRRWDRWDS